jgi:hypothetical protein
VPGIEVRRLDPDLCLLLEVIRRAPARSAVRRLVGFLLEKAMGPDAVITRRSAESDPPEE